MRTSTFSLAVLALLGSGLVNHADAQHHHWHGHYQQQQKGSPEAAPYNPTPESAGYAAPPRSGTREGATGGLGINGPTIELPAMSLKFPTIRIPGFTRFMKPPHMRVADSIAPLVSAARKEFTFEAGTTGNEESAPFNQPPGTQESAPISPQQKELQKTYQKAVYDDCPECQRELQRQQQQQQLVEVQVDDALEQRITRLEQSIGKLVDGLEAAQLRTQQNRPQENYLQPFPAVTSQAEFPIRRSSYQHVGQQPPRLLPAQALGMPSMHRLPQVR